MPTTLPTCGPLANDIIPAGYGSLLLTTEDGLLTLDDPLALCLPEVAEQLPYGDQITLRHLLTHTSGLFNVVEHEDYWADLFAQMVIDEGTGSVTLDCVERDPHDTLARYVYGKEAHFEPGAQWRYSDTNYTLFDYPASLDAMTTAAPGSSYGLGVTIQEAYMGHAGYIAGFRSVLNCAPESDTVMVMLSNNDTADPEQGLTDVLSPGSRC